MLHAPRRIVLVLALISSVVLANGAAPPAALAATDTTTTVAASTASPTVTQSITLTATLTPDPGAGSVSWRVDGQEVSVAATQPGGTASWTSNFALGSHEVIAVFAGNESFGGSTSQPLAVTARLVPTVTTLVAAPSPADVLQSVTFTASVVSDTPTSMGRIDWTIDGVAAGSSPLGGDGRASTTRSWADPGDHTARATYVEGTTWDTSASDLITVQVHQIEHDVSATPRRSIVAAGEATTIQVQVAGAAAGTVRLTQGSDVIDEAAVDGAGTADLHTGSIWSETSFTVAYFAPGATGTSGTAVVWITTRSETATFSLTATPNTVGTGEEPVRFVARTENSGASGWVEFFDHFNGVTTSLGGSALVQNSDAGTAEAVLSVRLTGVGSHTITASYGGDDYYAPPEAEPSVVVTVTGDTSVVASGVGVSYGTFYPYKDGYRDTVAIRGTPGEPMKSVSIRIYNSSGRSVRSWSYGSRTAAWSIAWNGRTASGTRVANGKYKVVQTLRDLTGHSKAYTSYTNVSGKRLYWYTSSVTKYADSGSFEGLNYTGYAWYAKSSSYYRGIVISGGTCDYDYGGGYEVCDGVIGRYRFTLPSAVKYSSIRVLALGKSYSGYGNGAVGVHNYADDELDGIRLVGYSWAWHGSGTVGSSGHVNGSRVVTGVVAAIGSNDGALVYQKVRVTFKYALLK